MTKIRRFPFFSAAAVLALTVPLSALADYPDLPPEPPRAASSFIGMGAATGTPSGDVAQAVKPVLRSLPVPTMVQSAPFNKSDLYAVPVTTNFPRPLKIGVQASLGLSSRAQWLRFTLEELKYVLGEANLEILWFDNRQLELGVKSRQLDFILADADELANPSTTFAATSRDSLAGWDAAVVKLFQHGISRIDIEDRTTFYGWSSASVLHAVLSRAQTVGILPACELEKLENRGKVGITHDLSIFSPQRDDTLSCAHSTITYPSITVGVLRTLDPAWKKAVSTVLYAAASQRYGGEWALPAVNRTIYDLFYELKRGPYENLGSWNLNRFLRENAEFIAFALLAAFIIISYAVSLSVLVKRKTAQLRRALEEREMIEAEAVQSRQHIANLERTGIVGQMSTIIAHELKQPLAAIVNFAGSLNRRVQKGNYDEKAFGWALGEILDQAERANQIVNRVRAYAKHDYPPRTIVDLYGVIGNAITNFRRARQTAAEVIVRVNKHSMAEVDAWEIELAVLNLMKNAADAISGVEHPKIIVSLTPIDEKTWALSVEDNGPYITDEAFDNLFKPLQTTKGADGMGLGLSIIASIAERHAGRCTVERAGAQGLRFTLVLPRIVGGNEPDLAEDGLPPKMTVYKEGELASARGADDFRIENAKPKTRAATMDPNNTNVSGI
ncbi:ATP-binding protein [Sutterella wadsworthensis]|uniref:ATP-binding protein n=1 Tax=Sutterella wadsworthensis TaxID=40545 RepID=UPI00402A7AC8